MQSSVPSVRTNPGIIHMHVLCSLSLSLSTSLSSVPPLSLSRLSVPPSLSLPSLPLPPSLSLSPPL